jgi:hypothetical protein
MTPARRSLSPARRLAAATAPARRAALLLGAALALALGAPAELRAQSGSLPKKDITEATSTGFGKLQPLVAAKDYPAALALAEQLLAAAPPASYDVYVLSQIQAQILLTQNRLAEAIAPLERAQTLSLGNANFFDSAAHLERLYLLAQLHYQDGAEQKEPALQRAAFERALAQVRDWLARSPRPTPEVRLFAASLLYSLGTLDAAKPDAARLREAIEQAREALLLAPRPGNQVQLLLVACHLQLLENARAAELLEVLAEREPKNANTWSQLQSLYLAAASDNADPAAARAANLRALLTLERAQAQGLLASPKDHYTKVAILFNLQQFTRAAELLETGLADGRIEPSKRNWELLASAYQQTAREEKALDALTRAVAAFPADAGLEFSLAQFLYGAGRPAEAYARGQSALAKPGLERPGQTKLYLAFLAYELQRFEEASKWVSAARDAGDVPASSLDPLERAITDALAAREALKKS